MQMDLGGNDCAAAFADALAGPGVECPEHFAAAQAAIDKASEQIRRMEGGMPLAAHGHLRYAKMSLVEAKYHHAQTGNYHHARAIVRANEARGHAIAGELLTRGIAKQ